MKKIIIIIALLLIINAGTRAEQYTLNVTTAAGPITAHNTRGDTLILYPAVNEDNTRRVLLENVKPNTQYTVTLYTNNTASFNDDHIVKVMEVQ